MGLGVQYNMCLKANHVLSEYKAMDERMCSQRAIVAGKTIVGSYEEGAHPMGPLQGHGGEGWMSPATLRSDPCE